MLAPTGHTHPPEKAGGTRGAKGLGGEEGAGGREGEAGGKGEETAGAQVSTNPPFPLPSPAHKKGASQYSPCAPFAHGSDCHRRLLGQAGSPNACAAYVHHPQSSVSTARDGLLAQLHRDRRAPDRARHTAPGQYASGTPLLPSCYHSPDAGVAGKLVSVPRPRMSICILADAACG